LVCDRALHRGHVAQVERIEPGFVWDATKDLGLELRAAEGGERPAPFAAPEIAPKTDTRPAVPMPTEQPAAPMPTVQSAAAMPTEQPGLTVTNMQPPAKKAVPSPVLSDFESESLLRARSWRVPPKPPSNGKRVATIVLAMICTIGVAGAGAFALLYSG